MFQQKHLLHLNLAKTSKSDTPKQTNNYNTRNNTKNRNNNKTAMITDLIEKKKNEEDLREICDISNFSEMMNIEIEQKKDLLKNSFTANAKMITDNNNTGSNNYHIANSSNNHIQSPLSEAYQIPLPDCYNSPMTDFKVNSEILEIANEFVENYNNKYLKEKLEPNKNSNEINVECLLSPNTFGSFNNILCSCSSCIQSPNALKKLNNDLGKDINHEKDNIQHTEKDDLKESMDESKVPKQINELNNLNIKNANNKETIKGSVDLKTNVNANIRYQKNIDLNDMEILDRYILKYNDLIKKNNNIYNTNITNDTNIKNTNNDKGIENEDQFNNFISSNKKNQFSKLNLNSNKNKNLDLKQNYEVMSIDSKDFSKPKSSVLYNKNKISKIIGKDKNEYAVNTYDSSFDLEEEIEDDESLVDYRNKHNLKNRKLNYFNEFEKCINFNDEDEGSINDTEKSPFYNGHRFHVKNKVFGKNNYSKNIKENFLLDKNNQNEEFHNIKAYMIQNGIKGGLEEELKNRQIQKKKFDLDIKRLKLNEIKQKKILFKNNEDISKNEFYEENNIKNNYDKVDTGNNLIYSSNRDFPKKDLIKKYPKKNFGEKKSDYNSGNLSSNIQYNTDKTHSTLLFPIGKNSNSNINQIINFRKDPKLIHEVLIDELSQNYNSFHILKKIPIEIFQKQSIDEISINKSLPKKFKFEVLLDFEIFIKVLQKLKIAKIIKNKLCSQDNITDSEISEIKNELDDYMYLCTKDHSKVTLNREREFFEINLNLIEYDDPTILEYYEFYSEKKILLGLFNTTNDILAIVSILLSYKNFNFYVLKFFNVILLDNEIVKLVNYFYSKELFLNGKSYKHNIENFTMEKDTYDSNKSNSTKIKRKNENKEYTIVPYCFKKIYFKKMNYNLNKLILSGKNPNVLNTYIHCFDALEKLYDNEKENKQNFNNHTINDSFYKDNKQPIRKINGYTDTSNIRSLYVNKNHVFEKPFDVKSNLNYSIYKYDKYFDDLKKQKKFLKTENLNSAVYRLIDTINRIIPDHEISSETISCLSCIKNHKNLFAGYYQKKQDLSKINVNNPNEVKDTGPDKNQISFSLNNSVIEYKRNLFNNKGESSPSSDIYMDNSLINEEIKIISNNSFVQSLNNSIIQDNINILSNQNIKNNDSLKIPVKEDYFYKDMVIAEEKSIDKNKIRSYMHLQEKRKRTNFSELDYPAKTLTTEELKPFRYLDIGNSNKIMNMKEKNLLDKKNNLPDKSQFGRDRELELNHVNYGNQENEIIQSKMKDAMLLKEKKNILNNTEMNSKLSKDRIEFNNFINKRNNSKQTYDENCSISFNDISSSIKNKKLYSEENNKNNNRNKTKNDLSVINELGYSSDQIMKILDETIKLEDIGNAKKKKIINQNTI